jgi:hypothetical protein
VESELYHCVLNTRKNGFAKVIYGWVGRSVARRDLTIRRRTTIAQRLPEAYKEKLISFQKYALKLRKQHEYLLGQIGNADQTPVFFDVPESTTVNTASERTVGA